MERQVYAFALTSRPGRDRGRTPIASAAVAEPRLGPWAPSWTATSSRPRTHWTPTMPPVALGHTRSAVRALWTQATATHRPQKAEVLGQIGYARRTPRQSGARARKLALTLAPASTMISSCRFAASCTSSSRCTPANRASVLYRSTLAQAPTMSLTNQSPLAQQSFRLIKPTVPIVTASNGQGEATVTVALDSSHSPLQAS